MNPSKVYIYIFITYIYIERSSLSTYESIESIDLSLYIFITYIYIERTTGLGFGSERRALRIPRREAKSFSCLVRLDVRHCVLFQIARTNLGSLV
jgi:hypothetical protein